MVCNIMDSQKLSFKLESILGSSSDSVRQLGQAQGCLLYVAGSYIVFYSPLLDEQVAYIKHRSPAISAISVSPNQKTLAVAERGKHPLISLYDIENLEKLHGDAQSATELKGHKQSIDLICFSPDGRYLLSVSNHDGSLFLWEGAETVARNRLTKLLNRAFFDSNGDLVTLGRGYFKVWAFRKGEAVRRKQEDCWMLEGRVLNFGKKFAGKEFIDAGVYKVGSDPDPALDKIVLLSSDGLLCIMQGQYERVEKWVDLLMEKTTSLEIVNGVAICAGDNALVKAVDLASLTLKSKFPKPPPTNKENICKDEPLECRQNEQFPPCLGVRAVGQFVVTLYANRAMFLWKMQEEVRAVRSVISHRDRIVGVNLLEQVGSEVAFFGTVSADRTVRIWHLYKKEYAGSRESIDVAEMIGLRRNAYCRNLTRIIYTDCEHPLTRIKMLQRTSVVGISRQECLIYSLENFELILRESFEDEPLPRGSTFKKALLSLETSEDLVYLGDEGGMIRIYRVNDDRLMKVREITMEMPVQTLTVWGKRLLAYGKGRMKCITLDGETLLNQYNIDCCAATHNYLIIGQKTAVSLFSLARQKKTASLPLTHQLQHGQYIRIVKSNSWLIAVLTTHNRLILSNFAATVLFSELLGEAITDCAVTEGGQVLLTTEAGTVLVKKQQSGHYHRIDQQVKKWFEQNDMSWMDGSVWASSKNQSRSSLPLRPLPELPIQDSIRLGASVSASIGLKAPQLPEVVFEYTNDDNKRSIFNPNIICAQANKIYQQVSEAIKNRKETPKLQQPQPVNSPRNLILSQSLEEINMENTSQNKQKRRIFGQKDPIYQPKFTNNLVQSVMNPNPPSKEPATSQKEANAVSTEDNDYRVNASIVEESINFKFSGTPSNRLQLSYLQENVQTTEKSPTDSAFFESVNQLLLDFEQLKDRPEDVQSLVIEHFEEYSKVYGLLESVLGGERRRQQKKDMAAKFKRLSETLLAELEQ